MPALAWENLREFLNTDDFAFLATVEGGRTFPVIIDEEYQRETMGGFVMTSASPTLVAKEKDLAGMKKRHRITVAGVDYWLTDDPEPDGTGMATAPLSRSHLVDGDAEQAPMPAPGAEEQWQG